MCVTLFGQDENLFDVLSNFKSPLSNICDSITPSTAKILHGHFIAAILLNSVLAGTQFDWIIEGVSKVGSFRRYSVLALSEGSVVFWNDFKTNKLKNN